MVSILEEARATLKSSLEMVRLTQNIGYNPRLAFERILRLSCGLGCPAIKSLSEILAQVDFEDSNLDSHDLTG